MYFPDRGRVHNLLTHLVCLRHCSRLASEPRRQPKLGEISSIGLWEIVLTKRMDRQRTHGRTTQKRNSLPMAILMGGVGKKLNRKQSKRYTV